MIPRRRTRTELMRGLIYPLSKDATERTEVVLRSYKDSLCRMLKQKKSLTNAYPPFAAFPRAYRKCSRSIKFPWVVILITPIYSGELIPHERYLHETAAQVSAVEQGIEAERGVGSSYLPVPSNAVVRVFGMLPQPPHIHFRSDRSDLLFTNQYSWWRLYVRPDLHR